MNTDISKSSSKEKVVLIIVLAIAIVAVIAFLIPLVGRTPTVPKEKSPYQNTPTDTHSKGTSAAKTPLQQNPTDEATSNQGNRPPDSELMVN